MNEKEIIQNPEQEPEKTTRVVVMLGARMKKTKGDLWSFPLISEPDPKKIRGLPVEVSGGDSRMRAIQAIYQEHLEKQKPNEELLVLTTGGKEQSGDSRADEAAKKLVKKYDLPEGIVKSLGSSHCTTLGNAGVVFEFIGKNKDKLGKSNKMEIVTNDFHALRAWIMFTFEEYKHRTGQDLKIKEEDVGKIKEILDSSLSDLDCSNGRKEVMEVIKPYIEGSEFKIKPVIVEDIIESSGISSGFAWPRFKGGEEYAHKIKKNRWVKKTRKVENQGVIDFLERKNKT